MAPRVVRSDEEISAVLDRCSDAENDGKSAYPGMSYEQGITVFYNWLTTKSADPVFED